MQEGYRYNRVLIDAARILDSPFFDAVLLVSGAQLELLRNMTQYLNERTTFVDTYHTNYYQLPNDGDWDEIRAIVADLELRLMGDMNTIFAYHDVYQEYGYDLDTDAAIEVLTFDTVPVGEVWVITQWSARDEYTQNTNTNLLIRTPFDINIAATAQPVGINRVVGTSVKAVLRATQYAQIEFEGCENNDVLWGYVSGYKMKVPTT
jgi:hypothetical protein